MVRVTRREGLRLDSQKAILEVIDPDDLGNSELLYRLTTDVEEDAMPPKKGGTKKLTPDQVGLFRQWVMEGVPFDQHWAYEPTVKADVPEGRAPGRSFH